MKRILIRLLAVCLCAAVLAGCGGAGRWKEQYNLGIRYLSEQNYEEAILAFTEAINIDPNQAELYIRRAGAYVYSGETADNLAAALADYEAARELDSADPDLWLGLADVYIRQGELIKALETLEQGLEATGGNEEIQAKIDEIKSGSVTDSQGRLRGRAGFDEAGEVIWFHAVRYDEENRESLVTHYDASGQELGQVKLRYDDQGREVQGYSYTGTTGDLIRVEYTYNQDGNWDRVSSFPLNGSLATVEAYTYDEAGQMVRTDQYTQDGQRMGSQVYGWDEETGFNSFIENYGADGTLDNRVDYKRDAQGRPVRAECTGPNGELISIVITEYRGDVAIAPVTTRRAMCSTRWSSKARNEKGGGTDRSGV